MAIVREAEVALTLEDFDRISRSTPYIADMKPSGRYVMADLSRYGGVALVGKRLLDAGLLHDDAMSVNGRTLAENINGAPSWTTNRWSTPQMRRAVPPVGWPYCGATSLPTEQ